jgi:hypothetical protein
VKYEAALMSLSPTEAMATISFCAPCDICPVECWYVCVATACSMASHHLTRVETRVEADLMSTCPHVHGQRFAFKEPQTWTEPEQHLNSI